MKRFFSLLLSALMILSLAACGSSAPSTPQSSAASGSAASASTAEPAQDPDRVMTFAASRYACPGAMDAFYCSSALGVWESLIATGPDGSPTGELVERYEYSDDAKVWTFHLRQGVVFHDGEPFNADAALFNFERMKKPITSDYTPLQYDRSFPGVLTIEKTDDYTLVFTFENSVPDLLIAMSGYGSPMFSPKCIGEDGNFIAPAAGTGPFKLAEENPEQYVTAERFDDYWGEKAQTKTIKFKTIKDADTRFSALKSEEVMGVVDLGAIQPNMAVELVKDERFALSTYKSTMTHLIAVNRQKWPFDDPRMTEAISLMIDRDLIVETIFSGLGVPTTNVLNHTSPYYINTPIEHDYEKGKALALEVMGGKEITAVLPLRQKDLNRYPQDKVAVYLKDLLKDVGINVEIQIQEDGLYGETIPNGEWDITVNKRQLPGATLEILESFLGSKGYSNADYYRFGYSNAEADALIEQVRFEMDPVKRQEAYTKLQEMLYESMLVIPYMHDESVVAYNKQIEGFGISYDGVTIPQAHWAQ